MTGGPRAVVVLTGSELVRGDLQDGNGRFLAHELTQLGLEPARLLIVGDREEELERAVAEGLAADVCILSGGLGPTHDDRTVEVLTRATGRRLVVDEELEREIETIARAHARRLGRPYADFSPGVRKQASLPEGAVAIGIAGTAPALVLALDGRVAAALPGPPGELRRLWPRVVESEPFRRALGRTRPPTRRRLRFFGASESSVARVLAEAGGEGGGVEITVCARDLEVDVDLAVSADGEERASALEGALRERLGKELFAADERGVEEIVLAASRRSGLTLATAESCTGGLVGARLTSVPGASEVYLGGVVAYADEVKRASLGVPEEVLERHGAVSAEAAEAMAAGARAALGADVGLAVTGIAGPGGGTKEKPVGLVFIHASSPDGELASRLELGKDRDGVRARATVAALHLLRELLPRTGDTRA